MASTIKLSRSGLGQPEKPTGCFLFSGPTGVGKTEAAKQLAQIMGIEFLRFDMSEYMEKHTVSRLLGAPPGYVGFDQGGLLTDAVRKTPYAVLLLDEIEKAHPDLFNVLLQVMDHATLTDNNGKKADFRNIILIMTTNAGGREMNSRRPGVRPRLQPPQGQGSHREDVQPGVPQPAGRHGLLPLPEPRGHREDRGQVHHAARRPVEREESHRPTRTPRPGAWLAERGYDPQFGARPMARLIDNEIKKRLADEILFGQLQNGGRVRVDAKDGELVFEYGE